MEHSDIRRVFSKGAEIFREGEAGDCAYIIEWGSVEITTNGNGGTIELARRHAGEIFGEMAIVDNHPRSATATAAEECQLLILSREQIERRLEASDPVVRMVLDLVLNRFRESLARIKSNALDTRASRRVNREASAREHKTAIDQIRLEQDLHRAIQDDELTLFYQPLISFERSTIIGFEALVRWRHPVHGLIPPSAFLPVAEESGLIIEAGAWILRNACHDLKAYQKLQPATKERPPLFMNVNISSRELARPEFVDSLLTITRRAAADPAHIGLEITESLLMQDPEFARVVLERCRAEGFRIAMDDFGTGYSSLNYLQRFPIDTIKIDRSFTDRMLHDSRTLEILRTIAGLARNLDMAIVAEGVELESQVSLLRDLGCSYGQGYLFSPPLSFSAMATLLNGWASTNHISPDPAPAIAPAKPRRAANLEATH